MYIIHRRKCSIYPNRRFRETLQNRRMKNLCLFIFTPKWRIWWITYIHRLNTMYMSPRQIRVKHSEWFKIQSNDVHHIRCELDQLFKFVIQLRYKNKANLYKMEINQGLRIGWWLGLGRLMSVLFWGYQIIVDGCGRKKK